MSIKTSDNSIEIISERDVQLSALQGPPPKAPRAFALPRSAAFPAQIFQELSNDSRKSYHVIYDWHAIPNHTFGQVEKKEKSVLIASNSWVEIYSESDAAKKMRLISRDTVATIKEFAFLEENWDSYGGSKISYPTIVRAITFFINAISKNPALPQPFISPSPRGGINFEWETCSSVLTHLIPEEGDDFFVYIIKDKFSEERGRPANKVDSAQRMEKIVLNWFDAARKA